MGAREAPHSLPQEGERGAVEGARQLPSVALAHRDRALKQDGARVVLWSQGVQSHASFRVAAVDAPEIRIRPAVSRQNRGVHADPAVGRGVQPARRQEPRPEPTDDQVRPGTGQGALDLRVQLVARGAECVQQGFRRQLTSDAPPTGGRQGREHARIELVPIAQQQMGAQR